MRGFERVADWAVKYNNNNVPMPVRSTSKAAGYDFFSPVQITIAPHSHECVFTNMKFVCEDDEFLMLCNRSSFGKRGMSLANGVGIIDADYYGNPTNDGNLGFLLKNNTDQPITIEQNEKIGQGIFMKYLIADDDNATGTRTGGFGSTGK